MSAPKLSTVVLTGADRAALDDAVRVLARIARTDEVDAIEVRVRGDLVDITAFRRGYHVRTVHAGISPDFNDPMPSDAVEAWIDGRTASEVA